MIYLHFWFLKGMLVPLPAVIIGLSLEKVQYTHNRFPPSNCVPSSGQMAFYSTNLPIDLLLGIGVIMLIVALWNIRKVYNNSVMYENSPFLLLHFLMHIHVLILC